MNESLSNPDDKDPVSEAASSGVTSITSKTKKWQVADAVELYNIEGWAGDYFAANEEGNLVMQPEGPGGPSIEILDVIRECEKQNVSLPCIIRFQDILRNRVERINKSFATAIEEQKFKGRYRGVYPIKVNQMREVVEEILDAGEPYSFGLEAGSKAELQIVLSLNKNTDALSICNGYKDKEYMQLAFLGNQLGRKVILVIEKFSELNQALELAKETGIRPMLGVRAKLATRGSGKWQESGGEYAKFGLNASEIIQFVEVLRERDMLDCLKLFHFHIGSQIPDIRTIKSAVTEGARLYAKIKAMGAGLEYFDVGGGLGIDYDGSQSRSDFSINYTLDEYARDVVYQLQTVCDEENIDHPTIVSESGRSLVAQHSCLMMKVIDSISPKNKKMVWKTHPVVQKSEFVQELHEIYSNINLRNALESYHDALAKLEEAQSRFKLGHLSLEERATTEQLVNEIMGWISQNSKRMKRIPDEFIDMKTSVIDQYIVNFSVFQSAPDHWAFDQLFPIVPIHRLNEKPKTNAILVDISCDSDGKIDRFISRDEEYADSIKLHALKENKPYFLGMFSTGAYQDIMGDMHNLFGRVNEVHVFTDDDDPEDFYIEEVIRGDTISSMMKSNQYSLAELQRSLKAQVDKKVKDGTLKPREGFQLVDFYNQVLNGYTYLRK